MSQNDYTFLKACRREEVDYTPVWIMRQAGRYMKEYREIRKKYDFLTMCKTPEIAAEVTLQPVNKLGVDAAILFSDILVLTEAMGVPLEFEESKGPILGFTVRDNEAVDKLVIPDPYETVPFVMDAIKILRKELEGRVPLIGFSGAPFTLASYMVEGKTSKQFIEIKSLMFKEPELAHKLFNKVSKAVTLYLQAQIDAGAQVVQIFDSWAGCLSPHDFKEFIVPYVRQIIRELKNKNDKVPVIYFAQGNPAILELAKQTEADVIGVDWRIELDKARQILGDNVAVQGNLDPLALFLPHKELKERIREVLDQAGGKVGHIFNLGHGITPPTPVGNAQLLVETVHEYSKR